LESNISMQDVSKRLSRNLYMMMGTPREDTKKIWKVSELSKASGVTPCVISRIKNDTEGKEKPTIETVVKLAKALKVDPAELLK